MKVLAALAEILAHFDLWDRPANDSPGLYQESPNPVTQNYQIDRPTADFGPPIYEAELMDHEFGASWGQPFTVPYSPPPGAEFQFVKFTMEVSSFGVQYDRLAHVLFNDIELWRPSTSEPRGRRSQSSYTKDMSAFHALLSRPGNLSVELDNLVTERLNGTFQVKLSAAYYNPPQYPSSNAWYEHEGRPADAVGKVLGCVVATNRIETLLPAVSLNTTRAMLQIFASGNGNDEFWYAQSSQADEEARVGPVRHLRVEIDGDLAGVVSPFYQVYTGGFQPALWTPFVAPNAYDVPAYHIDVTSFLPLLWGSDSRNLSIVVLNGRDEEVRHEWIFSAALMTWQSSEWLGESGHRWPIDQHNTTDSIVLPSVEVTSFTQTLVTAADLKFRNILTGALDVTSVQVIQERKVHANLVGETVISHESRGVSTTVYDARNYSLAYSYDISLVLEKYGITTALGFDLFEHGYSATEDLLARSHSVHYNGSWYLDPAVDPALDGQDKQLRGPGKSKRHTNRQIDSGDPELARQRVNGSDVFVKFRDPHRNGPLSYHQHAVSRNGTVLCFDKPPARHHHANYKSKVIENSVPELAGYPFVTLSDQDLRDRRAIRLRWLHHDI